MIEKPIAQITLRLIIVWLLVSIFLFYFGEWIIHGLLAYLRFCVNLLGHNYTAELSIDNSVTGKIISLMAIATDDIYRLEIPIAPKGTAFTGQVTLAHALVPTVILFTILFSWFTTRNRFITQIIVGMPMALLILTLTTPMLLSSHVEQVFHTAAQNYVGKELPMPFIMEWVVFMEMGGVWLLPIIGAFLCIKISAMAVPVDVNQKSS
ncbi:MAG: hypothetical protein V4732_00255 [Pseudomonadota bacterium]